MSSSDYSPDERLLHRQRKNRNQRSPERWYNRGIAGQPPVPVSDGRKFMTALRERRYSPLKTSPDVEAIGLEILLRPAVDPIQRFLDVLDRIRYAETQITFSKFTERRTCQTCA